MKYSFYLKKKFTLINFKSTSNKQHIAVLMPKKLAIYEMIGNLVLLKFIYF